MKTCKTCGKPLIALKVGMRLVWIHPDTDCSGVPDGVQLVVEHLEEPLIEKYYKDYGTPKEDIFGYLERKQKEKESKLSNRIKKKIRKAFKWLGRLPSLIHLH